MRSLAKENQKKIEKLTLYNNLLMCVMGIFAFGVLNMSVQIANGGKMPMYGDGYVDSDRHFGYTDRSEVNMWMFTDTIPIGRINYSIGDFGMIGSLLCAIYYRGQINKIK